MRSRCTMNRERFALLVILSLCANCAAESEPSLDLLGDPSSDETAWDSRRVMMNITVQRLDGNGNWGSPVGVDYADPSFESDITSYCESIVRASSAQFSTASVPYCNNPFAAPSSCPAAMCMTQVASCVALTYLEMASNVSATELHWTSV